MTADLLTARNILQLASRHANENTSARSCLQDALTIAVVALEDERHNGTDESVAYARAIRRGIESLLHSVGIFHVTYKTACEIAGLDANTAHSDICKVA